MRICYRGKVMKPDGNRSTDRGASWEKAGVIKRVVIITRNYFCDPIHPTDLWATNTYPGQFPRMVVTFLQILEKK